MRKPVQIVRKKLTPADVSNPNLRYNSSCDCIQITPDGGATWYDMPSLDPRSSPSLQFPARGGDDPRCDAAANMLEKLQAIVTQFTAGLDQLQLVNTLVAILVPFMPEVALLIVVIEAVAAAALAIGAFVIAGAFTSDQWDLILCILDCGISDDGTVTADQLNNILVAIHDQCNSIVYDVMYFVLPSLGNVGLSNAGASGDVVGDCDACACAWCYEWDLRLTPDVLLVRSIGGVPFGTYIAGVGFQPHNQDDGCSNHRYLYLEATYDPTITHVSSVDMEYAGNVGPFTGYDYEIAGGGNYFFPSASGHIHSVALDPTVTIGYININSSICDSDSPWSLIKLRYRGFGEMPAFSGGNVC